MTASLRQWFVRHRWSAVLAAFCVAIAAVGSTTVIIVTNRLVAETTLDYGNDWANYLVANLPEFPDIMAGETPSADSVVFLEQAKKSGKIFRYRLFDASGRLRIVSTELGKAFSYSADLASEVPEFTAHAAKRRAFAREMYGDGRDEPEQYALTYVPIVNGDVLAGWVEVAFDHTDQHQAIVGATTIMSLVMALLLAVGPGLGFWYRTRQKQEAEKTLSFMASHDLLTRLPNRDVLESQLDEALKQSARRNEQVALVHIEVARMQELAQRLDRRTIDAVLLELAARLKSEAGPLGTAARLSESGFALLKTNIHDAMDAARCAKSTLAALATPFDIMGPPLSIDVNIGLALSPGDGGTANELMKSAVLALLEARAAGRNSYRFFDASTESTLRRRRDLEGIVAEACEKKLFALHYQPYFELATARLLGFEALIRLTNPQYGSISPAEFIPVAETLGIISDIGAWTMEQACKTAATWPEPLKISVNLSPLQFRNGSIIVGVRKSLERAKFPAYRLELEVTEGVLLDNIDYVQEQLHALQEMGAGIVLDDFGSGYSSFGYLWQFPFNKLKIDQSFTRAIDSKANVKSILRAIIGLGRSLSLPLTAEGIETPEQAEFLRSIGCTQAQGFHFGRPVPEIEVAGIIMRNYAEAIAASGNRLGAPGSAAQGHFLAQLSWSTASQRNAGLRNWRLPDSAMLPLMRGSRTSGNHRQRGFPLVRLDILVIVAVFAMPATDGSGNAEASMGPGNQVEASANMPGSSDIKASLPRLADSRADRMGGSARLAIPYLTGMIHGHLLAAMRLVEAENFAAAVMHTSHPIDEIFRRARTPAFTTGCRGPAHAPRSLERPGCAQGFSRRYRRSQSDGRPAVAGDRRRRVPKFRHAAPTGADFSSSHG